MDRGGIDQLSVHLYLPYGPVSITQTTNHVSVYVMVLYTGWDHGIPNCNRVGGEFGLNLCEIDNFGKAKGTGGT